jgi:hypothetical protein
MCGGMRRVATLLTTSVTASGKLLMFRWFLVIFLAVIVFSAVLPWLEKFGVGKLPGDVRFTVFGKTIFLPFASTVLLSLVVFLVAKFF